MPPKGYKPKKDRDNDYLDSFRYSTFNPLNKSNWLKNTIFQKTDNQIKPQSNTLKNSIC